MKYRPKTKKTTNKLQCEIDLSNFNIELIQSTEDFVEFLTKIQNDEEYRTKCVCILIMQ